MIVLLTSFKSFPCLKKFRIVMVMSFPTTSQESIKNSAKNPYGLSALFRSREKNASLISYTITFCANAKLYSLVEWVEIAGLIALYSCRPNDFLEVN